ncbi:MAG: ABC transporter permease [Desulfovibrionaceae bacterium]
MTITRAATRALRVLGMAFAATRAYKLRAAFVVAAVALGISALALIVAAVDGAQQKAHEIVDWFGPDAAFILGGDITSRAVGRRSLTLTWDDVRRLREALPGAYLVTPMRAKSEITVRHGSGNWEVGAVVGTTEDYASAWNWPLAEGRDLTPGDVAHGAKVALIGATPARELFGAASPIGQTIFLGDLPVRIVGRLLYRGAMGGGGDVDDRIVIPLTTLTQRFNLDRNYFRALRVKFLNAGEPGAMASNVNNLRSLLRSQHGLRGTAPDDFTVLTADEILAFLSMLKGSLVAFLGVTAGVGILVGGFVLANLFYLSVSERTHEIGLRKALGARNNDILLQFLAEAVCLTLIGSLLGVALGAGMGGLLERLDILQIRLSAKVVGLSVICAVAIGVVFGLRPARRAALLDPIEALKG